MRLHGRRALIAALGAHAFAQPRPAASTGRLDRPPRPAASTGRLDAMRDRGFDDPHGDRWAMAD
eukprot:6635784-Prymnesium_polylepis.1